MPMTPKIQQRIARVKAALVTIQKKATVADAKKAERVAAAKKRAAASKKPVSAKPAPRKPVAAVKDLRKPVTLGGRPRTALSGSESSRADRMKTTERVAPVLNNIDAKTTALDKMISGLLSAIDSGNTRNTKTLMESVIKKLRELGAEGDRLEPLTASAKSRKAAVAKVMARGRLAVARARKSL